MNSLNSNQLHNHDFQSLTVEFNPEVDFGINLTDNIYPDLDRLGFVSHYLDIKNLRTGDLYIEIPTRLAPVIPKDKRVFVVLPHYSSMVMPITWFLEYYTKQKIVEVQVYPKKNNLYGFNFVYSRKYQDYVRQLSKIM